MKILLAIPTCQRFEYRGEGLDHTDSSNNRVDWIRNTWLFDAHKAGLEVRFFYDRSFRGLLKPDETVLDCSPGYMHLAEKMQAVYRWAISRQYDFVVKCDDDSYLYPTRFLNSFTESEYKGMATYGRLKSGEQCIFAGGPLYQFGHQAMSIILNEIMIQDFEDVFFGHLLSKAGISLEDDQSFVCDSPTGYKNEADIKSFISAHCYYPEMRAYYSGVGSWPFGLLTPAEKLYGKVRPNAHGGCS